MALYEYIITFDREVSAIWQKKYTLATILWTLVRCYQRNCFDVSNKLIIYLPFRIDIFYCYPIARSLWVSIFYQYDSNMRT